MGFVNKVVKVGSLGLIDDVTGADAAADAATQSARVQQEGVAQAIDRLDRASAEGQEFLAPFEEIGQQGLNNASFLTDPQAQFDFLQNNPLFNLALDNANTQTTNLAAARGRLSAGDTLQQLSNNVLLSASPLISQQKSSITDLLGRGQNLATTQANTALGTGSNVSNLITSGAAAEAGGIVGAANANSQGLQSLLQLGGTLGGAAILAPPAAASDIRLKKNISKIGESNGFNLYSWTWNDLAKSLFKLTGDTFGVIAQEVMEIRPDAVIEDNGYLKVDYSKIGVNHGG